MFSFNKRKEQDEVASVLRRMINRTTPNITTLEESTRFAARHFRSVTVLLTPRSGRKPLVERSITGVTRDISDHGIAVIVKESFSHPDILISFWPAAQEVPDPEPIVLSGSARHCMELGGGFWQVGIEVTKRLHPGVECQQLLPWTVQLIPTSTDTAGHAAP